MSHPFIAPVQIRKFTNSLVNDQDDWLAVEEPLEIQLITGVVENRVKKVASVTMRTPGHDEQLATGFLYTEGIIKNRQEILSVEQDVLEGNKIIVALRENVSLNLQKLERNFYTSSSCGVCGKSSIDAIKTVSAYNYETDTICIEAGLFYRMQDLLKNEQTHFARTGGLHASALFDMEGNFIKLREDVGRHNALDKLIGAAFLNEELPLNNTILLLSGRASFELIQKACMAGIKVITAVGAPSSLAVALAREYNITLIGFLRNERFNIYAGEQRIKV